MAFNTNGMSLAEIRRRIRGPNGGGQPAPPVKQPERLGDVLERIGFGKQWRRDNERDQ